MFAFVCFRHEKKNKNKKKKKKKGEGEGRAAGGAAPRKSDVTLSRHSATGTLACSEGDATELGVSLPPVSPQEEEEGHDSRPN